MIRQTSVGQTIVLCGLPAATVPEPGTGPRPLFCRVNQPCVDRIVLDIPDNVLQLSRRTYPMIVGVTLPKSLSAASQDAIGNPAGSSFKPTHNGRHRDMRIQHRVHMVWHDRPGVKVVGMANGIAMLESILNHSGDTLVPQPKRPRTASVEPLVANVKRNTSCVLGRENLGRNWRGGPREAPSHKDNAAIRKPMRQVAAIKKHIRRAHFGRPQKTMVCPTAIVLTKI